MTAFLRPNKPPFIMAEPGSHGDQWLMSEKDLEEYAKTDMEWNASAAHAQGLRGRIAELEAQRVPLTDEQIADAVREADLDWHHGWTLDETEPNRFTQLVRAIERAHGIEEGKR